MTTPTESTTRQALLPHWIDAIEASGRRCTPQRQAVCTALLGHGGHPSPAEVYNCVHQSDPSISQATVYNTVALLEELGLIRKLDLAEREHTHYDVITHAHVNVVCRQCGRITDVHTDALDALLGLVSARSGYAVQSGGVTMYGLCAQCQQAG